MFSLDAEITVDPEVCDDATESANDTIDSGSWLQDLDLEISHQEINNQENLEGTYLLLHIDWEHRTHHFSVVGNIGSKYLFCCWSIGDTILGTETTGLDTGWRDEDSTKALILSLIGVNSKSSASFDSELTNGIGTSDEVAAIAVGDTAAAAAADDDDGAGGAAAQVTTLEVVAEVGAPPIWLLVRE